MNNYRSFCCLFLMVALATLFSCKKKNSDNPFSNARFTTIDKSHSGSIQHYHIFYDASNTVESITYTGDGTSAGHNGFMKFNYFGSSYSITDETGFTYTVLANTNGQILKLQIADTTSMIYNGNELGEIDVRTTKLTYPYYVITPTNYYWKNGDIQTVISNNVTKVYEYDNAKNGQPGDAVRIDQFLLYGRSFTKTARLPKQISVNGTWTDHYYYQFDGSGRISQYTKVRNNNGAGIDDTTTYSYQYY